MTPADAVAKLAQDLAEDGMVMKAVLIYDMIDEEGHRDLNFVVTDKTAMWDLQGMLTGSLASRATNTREAEAVTNASAWRPSLLSRTVLANGTWVLSSGTR